MVELIVEVSVWRVGGYHLLLYACGSWRLIDVREVDMLELEAEIERLRSLL